MTIVFDGKTFAAQKEVGLRIKIFGLKAKGITPHLVSILIGSNPASKLYVTLKQKAAQRVGATLEVYEIGVRKDADYIIRLIKFLNEKEDVHGIMVQLPLPPRLQKYTSEIVNSIASQKDVDGLRDNSKYLHPTSMAILQVMEEAKRQTQTTDYYAPRIVVVGSTGMVGKPLMKELEKLKYERKKVIKDFSVVGVNSQIKNLKAVTKKADILISATGVAGLITEDMVKRGGLIALDVGAPYGDFNYEQVAKKSKFITPVPGGVGPVTIACLLENLVAAAYNTN